MYWTGAQHPSRWRMMRDRQQRKRVPSEDTISKQSIKFIVQSVLKTSGVRQKATTANTQQPLSVIPREIILCLLSYPSKRISFTVTTRGVDSCGLGSNSGGGARASLRDSTEVDPQGALFGCRSGDGERGRRVPCDTAVASARNGALGDTVRTDALADAGADAIGVGGGLPPRENALTLRVTHPRRVRAGVRQCAI